MGTEHIVNPGECLTSLAARFGFSDFAIIWNHPRNARLRKARACPNVLNPGDVVFIPDQTHKSVSGATGQTHEFVVRRLPVMLKILLQDRDGKPLPAVRYVLEVAGETRTGIIPADGLLQEEIPAGATRGKLTLPTLGLDFPLQIGHLDPVDQVEPKRPLLIGIQSRLQNLGFYAGQITGAMNAETQTALTRFQHDVLGRAEADGTLDAETQEALTQKHGC